MVFGDRTVLLYTSGVTLLFYGCRTITFYAGRGLSFEYSILRL